LHFRTLLVSDLKQIDDIYNKYYASDFTLPNLVHTIGSGVISDNSSVVGFGMVKLYPEALIVLDKSKPKTTQGRALKLLFREAIRVCRERQFDTLQAHSFAPDYSNLLHKHFHFHINRNIDRLELEIEDGKSKENQ